MAQTFVLEALRPGPLPLALEDRDLRYCSLPDRYWRHVLRQAHPRPQLERVARRKLRHVRLLRNAVPLRRGGRPSLHRLQGRRLHERGKLGHDEPDCIRDGYFE